MINNIDIKLSQNILDLYNNGTIGRDPKAQLKEIPGIDNITILERNNSFTLKTNKNDAVIFFKKYNLPENLYKKWELNNFTLDGNILNETGVYLYPFFAFGVLNGGSATSYVDSKKNISFDEGLFNNFKELFNKLSKEYKGKAKGITPAFINPDGSAGPSFMELKMRSLLLKAKDYFKLTNEYPTNLLPIFQMTSSSNNNEINSYYKTLNNSVFLKDLINETGLEINKVTSGIQPLITAFTHSKEGDKKDFFKDINNQLLGLPGGHGQCFMVLKEILSNLYNSGKRFISIGNVDNIGYTLDAKSLAILAITDKQASFDFSYKTKFDVKGGVLIKDQFDNINCADLGVAVSKDDIIAAEDQGKPILFNCATGLFNLEYLITNIDSIITKLPTRFSDQNKDAGEYSQGEQVTWEIIGILDNFLIYAVDKYDRFLASKLLLENLVTSGLIYNEMDLELKSCGEALNKGLKSKLEEFQLELKNGKWRCK